MGKTRWMLVAAAVAVPLAVGAMTHGGAASGHGGMGDCMKAGHAGDHDQKMAQMHGRMQAQMLGMHGGMHGGSQGHGKHAGEVEAEKPAPAGPAPTR